MARASERIGTALTQHGYEQVRTVGEGSFGKAILARPVAPSDVPQKDVIVKMIDISKATKKEREDALQESQVLSSLKHPNIVRYRNNFLAEGWLCIVMDYCEGGDLSGRIKKARTQRINFSEAQVLWWFAQGVQALKHIHDLHILHRDLKSANFFLSRSGNLKLGDFGIAKVLECTAACAQTQVGTPYYLCPEICKGKPYSWGSDIWSMGCILYEMCALKVPFDGHDLKSLIQNILKTTACALPDGYSKELQVVVSKLLNKDATCRPDADEILEIPKVRATVEKMNNDFYSNDSASEVRPASAAGSAVSSGQYSDSAGTFSKHDKVEYHSATHCEWLPATVTAVDSKGQIIMDVKPNTWLSVEVQAEKVRPASDNDRTRPRPCAPLPEPKTEKRPSSGAGYPVRRNSAARGNIAGPQPQPLPPRRASAPAIAAQRAAMPEPRQAKLQAPAKMARRPPCSGREGKYSRSPRGVAAANLGA